MITWLANFGNYCGKQSGRLRSFIFKTAGIDRGVSLSEGEKQPALILRKERRFVLAAVLILTLFGILMLYEASSIYAYRTTSDPAYFFKRQFLFFFFGLGLFFLTLLLDLEFLRKYSKELLIVNIFLLLLVLLIGRKTGGARRWFFFSGLNLQPSELLKIFFLIYSAEYLRRKGKLIKNLKKGLMPLGIVLGLVCLSLVLEPDLGTALFFIIWVIFLLSLFGSRYRHIFLIIFIGIVFSFFLVKFYPYRFRRVVAYLDPFADPRGAGFQLIQSQIAYGEGGILGVGLGEGKQKLFFLPAAHTDFIFSIIAEEFGLLGSLTVLFVFFILLHKMVKIAKVFRQELFSADFPFPVAFREIILWGVILIFFLEIVINIGVSCGLFPTKGLPLPFLSYGGSSLVVNYILLGLFFNASRIGQKYSSKSTQLVER